MLDLYAPSCCCCESALSRVEVSQSFGVTLPTNAASNEVLAMVICRRLAAIFLRHAAHRYVDVDEASGH